MRTNRFRDAVAEHFRAHPNEWIPWTALAAIGGAMAWRTRVSECRCSLGMPIDNRLRKVNGKTLSEYRYVQRDPQQVSLFPASEERGAAA